MSCEAATTVHQPSLVHQSSARTSACRGLTSLDADAITTTGLISTRDLYLCLKRRISYRGKNGDIEIRDGSIV